MKNSNFQLRQQARKPRSKKLLLIGLVLLVILAAGGYLAYSQIAKPSMDKNASDPTITSAKEQSPDEPTAKNTNSEASNITAQEVPASQTLGVTISNFNQANNMVASSANISGTASVGTCVFTFSATDSRPFVEQVTSIAQGSSQTCSISISEVRFDKIGTWNLDVTFFQNNTKASATRQVNIN